MKILVTAYACDPYRGSEPGVGWSAVCCIAQKHDVWVLTDIHNKDGWERGANEGIIPSNVHVRFLRDRNTFSSNRFIAHLQSWKNYASFNRQILDAASAWHQQIEFDLCHQVTIAAWRMPSPLWRLPIPFVWGPVGGAGYIPPEFRSMLSLQARVFEVARDINSAMVLRSKSFRLCMENTDVVIAANAETYQMLQPYRGQRAMLRLGVSSVSNQKAAELQRPQGYEYDLKPLQLFAGGNIEGRKGVSLALEALAKVKMQGIDFHYTVAGGGPEIANLKKLASKLGLESQVTFHPGFAGKDYIRALHEADVYFLPSFRETMGMTLVEAVLAGCYPVVANTSAQGEIVTSCGGLAVQIKSKKSLINELAEAIVWCANHRKELFPLACKAADQIVVRFGSERYDETLRDAYAIALNQE
jgi:glycosyltransferase involved in cell wall biosynthesis